MRSRILSIRYILRVFEWARKYGLRIYLDLHTVPGSQNGEQLGSARFDGGVGAVVALIGDAGFLFSFLLSLLSAQAITTPGSSDKSTS